MSRKLWPLHVDAGNEVHEKWEYSSCALGERRHRLPPNRPFLARHSYRITTSSETVVDAIGEDPQFPVGVSTPPTCSIIVLEQFNSPCSWRDLQGNSTLTTSRPAGSAQEDQRPAKRSREIKGGDQRCIDVQHPPRILH